MDQHDNGHLSVRALMRGFFTAVDSLRSWYDSVRSHQWSSFSACGHDILSVGEGARAEFDDIFGANAYWTRRW